MNTSTEHTSLWINTIPQDKTLDHLPSIEKEGIICFDATQELNEEEYDQLLQSLFKADKIICS